MVSTSLTIDPTVVLEASTIIRKLLSIEVNPPIQAVLDTGILPRVVELLDDKHPYRQQFEASWILTNIGTGDTEQTRQVVQSGAVPILIHLLDSSHKDVQEQAIWALGNLAGDSPEFRDFVLTHETVEKVLRLLHTSTSLSTLRNATWALSNFCRGKPRFGSMLICQSFLGLGRSSGSYFGSSRLFDGLRHRI